MSALNNELMQFFKYEHLPVEKQRFSKPFGEAAKVVLSEDYEEQLGILSDEMSKTLPENVESNVMRDKIDAVVEMVDKIKKLEKGAVRLLLEAKDCAVRSSFMK